LKLPRNLSGDKLAQLLSKFGYKIKRTTGSHIWLTSKFKSTEHQITIPAHKQLKIGTLGAILSDVCL
jgi:predicted RNA binding protein YcfA (HicA-like mRNA interferase family)